MRLFPRFVLLVALASLAGGLTTAATADTEAHDTAPVGALDGDDDTSMVLVRPADGLQLAGGAALDDLEGVEVDGTLDELGLVRVEVTPAGHAALGASSVVGAVIAEHPMELFLDESTVIVEADGAEADGFDGTGSLVVVIDSGVNPDQGAFGDRIVAEACFLDAVATPFETDLCPTGGNSATGPGSSMPCTTPAADCAHGTHVAGIAVSSLAPIEGVAPGAGLIAIRVMKDGGGPFTISSTDVLSALDHVLALARSGSNIAAVNLSLGGAPTICTDTSADAVNLVAAYEQATADLATEGVAVVAASGNSADALVPVTDVAFPACVDNIISVGATERSAGTGFAPDDGPELTEFTQYDGVGLDLVAPGFDIESPVPGGTSVFDGTSMAAPHVAAAFAILDGTQSGWTPERYAELLRSTGVMVERHTPDPGDRHERYPELRLLDALGFVPFSDATHGFWVAAADWAKYTGVSAGIGGNLYDPDSTLTRAQAVTFLWRLMGEPAPSGPSGFTDVPDGTFYTDAVAWAAEEGITAGTGGGLFEPNEPVTRAQMATFLWRLVGEPCCFPDPGFTDVPGTIFYTEAVRWMAANGITVGTSPTTFSPNDVVTRAQMITFIWRLVNSPDAWSGGVAPPDLVLF
ncbi:MAG: S-layer homology domain-containing protein [Actinomycetota bacterium]